MPLIDVTCSPDITDDARRTLARVLPDVVSKAVECLDEPYDGKLRPGDVTIRFHDVGPFDRFDVDVLIEVRSKWFADRAEDRERRVAQIHDAVAESIQVDQVGVYLSLPVAAWEQTE